MVMFLIGLVFLLLIIQVTNLANDEIEENLTNAKGIVLPVPEQGQVEPPVKKN